MIWFAKKLSKKPLYFIIFANIFLKKNNLKNNKRKIGWQKTVTEPVYRLPSTIYRQKHVKIYHKQRQENVWHQVRQRC